MEDPFSKSPLAGMQGLLCQDTLRSALRVARDSDIPAREGLKELLSPSTPTENLPTSAGQEFSRWVRCLDVLVEEFLSRKDELLRLNNARKQQIETFLQSHSKTQITLEAAVQSRLGSQEQEALQLFAHEACVFHLLQILLLKRWVDRELISPDCLRLSGKTLNWQITGFLRKNSAGGMISRHDWSFLKQNLFSWFSPGKDTWERLRLLLEPANLAHESGDFPARLVRSLGAHSRLSLLGFQPTLIDSGSLWRLLLAQKAFDLRLDSTDCLDFTKDGSGAVLISGLRNGESLNALRELSRQKELHGAWAFTDSEFERYLSEMFILWDSASEVPSINIHSRHLLRDLSRDATKLAPLFAHGQKMPYQAQFGGCFQDKDGKELEDVPYLLDQLRENGLLLIASDLFWPTDSGEACEKLREAILRKASVRLILDLRQLTSSSGETLPKGVFLLEKCSSKEVRDSNRPQILRARGHLHRQQLPLAWEAILEHIRNESQPGEVNIRAISTVGEGVRLEAMAAAASQHELRSSPWLTLSDPAFYEASGKLRRSPSKAFALGSVLRWKDGTPPPKGILVQEQSKSLLAGLGEESDHFSADAPKYLFLLEQSLKEHPAFYVAQMHSAPVQFWYRLELEQNTGKRPKEIERQSEKRLKLMPLVRLFEAGSLLPAPAAAKPIESIEETRYQLQRIFQGSLGLSERSQLHQIILCLEKSIRQNLEVCTDFSRHLFPSLPITRNEIPSALPNLSPQLVLDIFRHLDHSPILQHPAVHISKLRQAHDFKVTNVAYEETAVGALGELKVYHGVDVVLKLSGPSLLMGAVSEQMQKRIGRPWREISERITLPTDFLLVQTQLKEVVRSIERQLQSTRELIALSDQVFCCLFSLSSFTDESVRLAMRRHLSPNDSRIQVCFQKESVFKPVDLVSPTEILQ